MATAAASAPTPADCIKAVQSYVSKILKPRDKAKEITGMKCLLLDKDTKAVVSMVYSMNEILSKEVYRASLRRARPHTRRARAHAPPQTRAHPQSSSRSSRRTSRSGT